MTKVMHKFDLYKLQSVRWKNLTAQRAARKMNFFASICSLSLLALILANVLAVLVLFSFNRQNTRKLANKLQTSDGINFAQTPSQFEDYDIQLGNSLSCLIIQIDVAKKFRVSKPELALTALIEAESLAADSLRHLREKRHTKATLKESLVFSPDFAGDLELSALAGK